MKHRVRGVHKRQSIAAKDKRKVSSHLREVRDLISKRETVAGLQKLNQLAGSALEPGDQAKILSLVGDASAKNGQFAESAAIYQRASLTYNLDSRGWLRPVLGQIRSQLKGVQVEQAVATAQTAWQKAYQNHVQSQNIFESLHQQLQAQGSVKITKRPHRITVVASKLGRLFLQEGEVVPAKSYFQKALELGPTGSCRARQGLAEIALREGNPQEALRLSTEAIIMGKFQAKTVSAWPLYLQALDKLGQTQVDPRLLEGLQLAKPQIYARTTHTLVRELRSRGNPAWESIARKWLSQHGATYPVIAAEMAKMFLSEARHQQSPIKQIEAATALLSVGKLRPNEWLSGAKELIRATLFAGRDPHIESLLSDARRRFGGEFAWSSTHSFALSCMMAKKHQLARPLLEKNMQEVPHEHVVWGKTVWAYARMEKLLKNFPESAQLYQRVNDNPSVPLRFRLQAKVEWADALIQAGTPEPILASRAEITEALAQTEDADILMDFARQLNRGPQELQDMADAIFLRGESLALSNIAEAGHPSPAIEALFNLTRRQVYDFNRCDHAVSQWENLSVEKRLWLWTPKTVFWDYLGLIFEAYARLGKPDQAETLAKSYLSDTATPPEGMVGLGIPYGTWLVNWRRSLEALKLFGSIIQENPSNPDCAEAYYWLAMVALKNGDLTQATTYAGKIKGLIGIQEKLMTKLNLRTKALIILSGFNLGAIPANETFAGKPLLEALVNEIRANQMRLTNE